MATLIPTKYEKLSQNTVVVGASILLLLRKQKYNIEDLYRAVKREKQINLERFYSTLTFLWVTGLINFDKIYISLKNNNVSK
jgi:Fe2+ or Zn2+ uptake regulation protein